MTTVNTQDNPVSPVVGSRDADAVIIQSQQNTDTLVTYQIEKLSTSDVINIDNESRINSGGNIISVTRTTLKIILESRTKYRVRTKTQFGSFGPWVDFTTRDKRYQSPHAVTTLTDDTDSSAQTQGRKTLPGGSTLPQGGNRTIVVTNSGKAVVNIHTTLGPNRRGASVVNTDTVFADGQLQGLATINRDGVHESVQVPVVDIPSGAKVVNVPSGTNARIRYTNRGAIINTIG